MIAAPAGGVVSESALFDALAAAKVVYAGEKHDDAMAHRIQLAVLKGLHARKPKLAVGLEMVSRDKQSTLDDWSSGRMSDADFKAFWAKAWGFEYSLYAPILEYAKSNGIPLKALNAPIAVVSRVYARGLIGLTPEERAQLPAVVAPIADADYLAYATRAMTEGHGNVTPERLARMLEAQQAWNETMGESVLAALDGGADCVLVIAGSGHMLYRSGIAESVARRRAEAQKVVLPFPDGEPPAPLDELLRKLRDPVEGRLKMADFFWLTPS
ncbi:MAG: ChaN family lipoprotein [Elusimicrobia bacterium]|nr:ChaN family lipoprotein [Elusimicrobiota bacterium]